MSRWREHSFEKGAKYRVTLELTTPISHFSAGEIVEFCDTSYSRYDSSSAFQFRSLPSNEVKTWFLHDDEKDTSKEFFERMGNSGEM